MEALFGYLDHEGEFKEKVDSLRNAMKTVAARRNNSSHAYIISRSECIEDRSLVVGTEDVPRVLLQLAHLSRSVDR